MLKIGKGGVIDSLQTQKIVKLLLIFRGIWPQNQNLKSEYTTTQQSDLLLTCWV